MVVGSCLASSKISPSGWLFLYNFSIFSLALLFNLLKVLIAINIENAMIKKSTIVVIKEPNLIEELPIVKVKSLKSTFPVKTATKRLLPCQIYYL